MVRDSGFEYEYVSCRLINNFQLKSILSDLISLFHMKYGQCCGNMLHIEADERVMGV